MMPIGDYGSDPKKLISHDDYEEFLEKNPLFVRMPGSEK